MRHNRLAWLDALRGVAVLGVLVSHFGVMLSPWWKHHMLYTVNLGNAGVVQTS